MSEIVAEIATKIALHSVAAASSSALAYLSAPKFERTDKRTHTADMPLDPDIPRASMLSSSSGFSLSRGVYVGERLARTVASTAGSLNLAADACSDEMNLSHLAGIPCLIRQPVMQVGSVPDTLLDSWAVSPKSFITGYTSATSAMPVFQPTYAAMASTPFKYWRGTTKFRIVVNASAFHTARVRLSFYPLVNAPSAGGPAHPAYPEDVQTEVFDINGPCEFTFEVPFVFPFPYATRSIGRVDLLTVNGPPPVGSVVTAPIVFNVYASMSDDFQVADYSNHLYVPARNFESESPEPPAPVAVPKGWMRGSSQFVAEPETAPVIPDDRYFPDPFTSVADVLKAPQFLLSIFPALTTPSAGPLRTSLCFYTHEQESNYAADVTAEDTYSIMSVPSIAIGRYNPGGQNAATTDIWCQRVTPAVLPQIGASPYDLFSHFGACYLFQRGSMRYDFSVRGNAVASTGVQPSVSQFAINAAQSDAVSSAGIMVDDSLNHRFAPLVTGSGPPYPAVSLFNPAGATTLCGMFSGQVHSIEFPYRSPQLWLATRCPEGSALPEDAGGSPIFTIAETTATGAGMNFFRRAGDDFRYSYAGGIRECYLLVHGLDAATGDVFDSVFDLVWDDVVNDPPFDHMEYL